MWPLARVWRKTCLRLTSSCLSKAWVSWIFYTYLLNLSFGIITCFAFARFVLQILSLFTQTMRFHDHEANLERKVLVAKFLHFPRFVWRFHRSDDHLMSVPLFFLFVLLCLFPSQPRASAFDMFTSSMQCCNALFCDHIRRTEGRTNELCWLIWTGTAQTYTVKG